MDLTVFDRLYADKTVRDEALESRRVHHNKKREVLLKDTLQSWQMSKGSRRIADKNKAARAQAAQARERARHLEAIQGGATAAGAGSGAGAGAGAAADSKEGKEKPEPAKDSSGVAAAPASAADGADSAAAASTVGNKPPASDGSVPAATTPGSAPLSLEELAALEDQDVGLRLYQSAVRSKQAREARIAQAKQKEEDEFKNNPALTFRPAISDLARQIDRSGKPWERITDSNGKDRDARIAQAQEVRNLILPIRVHPHSGIPAGQEEERAGRYDVPPCH
jgi:hypothetical protein